MAPRRVARKAGTRAAKSGIRVAGAVANHPMTKVAKKQVKQAVRRKMNAKVDHAVNAAVRRIDAM